MLTRDELRFIMSAVGHELSEDELRELMVSIAGGGKEELTKEDFLAYVESEIQNDPYEGLREVWKITSRMTTTKPHSDQPKDTPGINSDDLLKFSAALGRGHARGRGAGDDRAGGEG